MAIYCAICSFTKVTFLLGYENMKICSIASGSSGNSTYIETNESKILIDAGISAKRIIGNLSNVGVNVNEIDAIFVSHEHIDHIRGVKVLEKKYGISVFMNKKTHNASKLELKNINYFNNENSIMYQDLVISPMTISHDAVDPCSFSIISGGEKVSVLTDFGVENSAIKKAINTSDALVIETNHDVKMLKNGRYPYYLKQRILSDKGHLSNEAAGSLVRDNSSERLKRVFLAHLSKNNNSEDLAMETFTGKISENSSLDIDSVMTMHNMNTDIYKV